MTGPALLDALVEHDLTKAEFSRLCGVEWKTVHRWCIEKLAVPQYAETIIDLLREIRALRLGRSSPRL